MEWILLSNYSVAHSFFNLCVTLQENRHFDLYQWLITFTVAFAGHREGRTVSLDIESEYETENGPSPPNREWSKPTKTYQGTVYQAEYMWNSVKIRNWLCVLWFVSWFPFHFLFSLFYFFNMCDSGLSSFIPFSKRICKFCDKMGIIITPYRKNEQHTWLSRPKKDSKA